MFAFPARTPKALPKQCKPLIFKRLERNAKSTHFAKQRWTKSHFFFLIKNDPSGKYLAEEAGALAEGQGPQGLCKGKRSLHRGRAGHALLPCFSAEYFAGFLLPPELSARQARGQIHATPGVTPGRALRILARPADEKSSGGLMDSRKV